MSQRPSPVHLRSALFTPGHRADRVAKARDSGADAVILDLEDAVPAAARASARDQVRARTGQPAGAGGPRWCVRVNPAGSADIGPDLDAAVGPGLLAVLLPKVSGPQDVCELDAELTRRESAAGLAAGQIRIWPLLESAAAVVRADLIAAASPRVAYLGGGTSDGGDLAASVGFTWTADGWETLYLRSKVLLDARAAGVPHPMTGVVTELSDPSVVWRFARQSRQLGYEGLMAIHPSQVPVANAVFGSTPDERARAAATLAALEEAERSGQGATRHAGRMVDAAMRSAAERVLSRRPAQPVDGDGE